MCFRFGDRLFCVQIVPIVINVVQGWRRERLCPVEGGQSLICIYFSSGFLMRGMRHTVLSELKPNPAQNISLMPLQLSTSLLSSSS